jgi:hypothetical protein
MSKRFSALFADLARDLGGEDALSAIDRALLSQAVGLMVRAERVKDTDDAVRLANASARLLTSLRKKAQRQPAFVPLRERWALEVEAESKDTPDGETLTSDVPKAAVPPDAAAVS